MWAHDYAVIEKSGSKMVIATKEEDRSLCKRMIARVVALPHCRLHLLLRTENNIARQFKQQGNYANGKRHIVNRF